jgi:hypothetical protein
MARTPGVSRYADVGVAAMHPDHRPLGHAPRPPACRHAPRPPATRPCTPTTGLPACTPTTGHSAMHPDHQTSRFTTSPSLCTSSLWLRALVAHDGRRRPSRYATFAAAAAAVRWRRAPCGSCRGPRACVALRVVLELLGMLFDAPLGYTKLPAMARRVSAAECDVPWSTRCCPGARRVARIARRWSCVPFVLCCLAPGSPPCNASPATPVDAACVLWSLAWLCASGVSVPARGRAATSDRAVLLACWGVRGVQAHWCPPGVLLCKPLLPLLRLLRLRVRVARSGLAARCWRARAAALVPVSRSSSVVSVALVARSACCALGCCAAHGNARLGRPPSSRSCDPDARPLLCFAGRSLRGAAVGWWGAVLVSSTWSSRASGASPLPAAGLYCPHVASGVVGGRSR